MKKVKIRFLSGWRRMTLLSVALIFVAASAAVLLNGLDHKVSAATVSFNPTADAWLDYSAGHTTDNHGSDTDLYNVNTSGAAKKTYLKFSVTGIPAGYVVSSATLRLYANNASGSTINLKPVSDTTWGESTINSTNAPAYGGTAIANSSVSATGFVDFPLGNTSVTGNADYSFATTTSDAVNTTDWSSKEGSNAPQLVVNYAPADATSPLTVNASADAYVSQASSTTNYGSDAHLYNVNTTSAVKRTFLKFDVAGIPAGDIVTGFTVKTYANAASGSTINLKQGNSSSWTESGITWANAPTYNATALANVAASAVGYVSFPVAGGTVVSGNGSYTFVMTTSDAVNTTDWSSKEGTNAPQLVVTFKAPSPLTVNPSADAYVDQANPSTNYGTATTLLNNNTSSSVKRSWYKFSVPALPLHARVTSAQLKLTATNSPSGVTANVKQSVTTSWDESTLNWNNAPTYNSTAISNAAPAPVVAGVETFDVTSAVTGSGALTFVVTQSQAVETDWASRESATPPQLTVTWTTEPSYGHDMVLAAAGDIACDPADTSYNSGNGTSTDCNEKATAAAVASFSPDRVLTLGDNQYECGGLSAFQSSYGDAASWGQFLSITSPVNGNHERNSTGGTDCDATSKAAGFRSYFQNAYTPPPTDVNAGLWWSEDLPNNWHVIALDSDCSRSPNPCTSGGQQDQWLQADLTAASNSGRKIFAIWHHPTYSQGDHGDAVNGVKSVLWHDLFTYGGGHVQFVMNGHEHNVQEFSQLNEDGSANTTNTGVREFIVGSGGKNHYSATLTSAADASLVAKDVVNFQVVKLTLHSSSFDINYVPESGGTTLMSSTTETYNTH